MEVSPYLNAIQTLNGRTPGEKYKELHSIAGQIIENEEEQVELLDEGTSDRVKPALLPYLKSLVGSRLRIQDCVIEALQSEDLTVIKQAFNAKWFFHSSNESLRANYFAKNIFPYITVRTRLELIKRLAHCLHDRPERADDFFECVADMYGIEQAMPLIVACSESHIAEAIFHRRLDLPTRILTILYRKHPDVVIRYLRLGNESCANNIEDRRQHVINLKKYATFLPILVKHHTQEFVELCECVDKSDIKLGSTRAEFFLKNATDVLISKPKSFLSILPLKLVSNKLTTQQFETMFENLMPSDPQAFCMESVNNYLKYYPLEKKGTLIMEKYQEKYGTTLPATHILPDSFYKMLPVEVKEQYGREICNSQQGTPDYYKEIYRLPPKESIPLLKERIKIPSDQPRSYWISQMIESCALYDSKEDLLEVLRYYNERHKNEQETILLVVLNSLNCNFNLKTLDKSHWQELRIIIQRMYVKDYLYSLPSYTAKPLLGAALCHYLKQCQADVVEEETKTFLNRLVDVIVESYMEHDNKWPFIVDVPELKRDCLVKFLTTIADKYPVDHAAWDKVLNKLSMTTYLIEAMHDFNVKNSYAETKKMMKKKKYNAGASSSADAERKTEAKLAKFSIKDYPWLCTFAMDLLKLYETLYNEPSMSEEATRFRQALINHDREYYQSLIDSELDLTNEVNSSDGLFILKNNSEEVLRKWEQYLDNCRARLRKRKSVTKRFIHATKWYQDIPIKFVEKCLTDIREKSSILVLGILLEGPVLGRVVDPYLPHGLVINPEEDNTRRTYEIVSSLPRAINLSNPPMPMMKLFQLCKGDYLSLGAQSLNCVAQRTNPDKVCAFATHLTDGPVSMKKLGIRLVFQVTTQEDSRKYLADRWREERSLSIREVVADLIFNLFKETPNPQTWELMKVCINGLTANDTNIFELLNNLEVIDKNYLFSYLEELFSQINGITGDNLSENVKSDLMNNILQRIDKQLMYRLPENLIRNIIQKQILGLPTSFTIKAYLISDESKFLERLDTMFSTLRRELMNFDLPDTKKSRYFPVNYKAREFFTELFSTMINFDNKPMCKSVVTKVLKIFEAPLKPCMDARTYISFLILQEYLDSESAEDFGVKVGALLNSLVETYNTEYILRDVSDILAGLLHQTNAFKGTSRKITKLQFIEALMQGNQRLGALLGISLLHYYKLSYYNHIYEDLLDTYKLIEDPGVEAALHNFISEIPTYSVNE